MANLSIFSTTILFSLLFSSSTMASAAVAEKATHFTLYMHEVDAGPNATVAKVVSGPASNSSSPRHFGDVVVVDNPLKEGTSPESELVARAQGFAVRVSLDGLVSNLHWNVVFEAGKFNGSSLAVFGRVPLTVPVREIPIVGGSGSFRLARGYILSSTVYYNLTTGGVVHLDFYVVHS